MEPIPAPRRPRLRAIVSNRPLWIVGGMLTITTLLHYYTPRLHSPLSEVGTFLSRHALERILYILPVVGATLAFGHVGGLIALAVSILAMLPRAIWLSPYPVDALLETAAIAAVSFLVIWIVSTQESEKRLRQKAFEEMEAISAVATMVSRSPDLNSMLDQVLGKVLEALHGRLEPKGAIFLLDAEGQDLQTEVHRGLPLEFVRQEVKAAASMCRTRSANGSGEPLFAADLPERTLHPSKKPDSQGRIIVPLRSRDRLLGVMFLYPRHGHVPSDQDRRLLASISSQIGMAIENTRLYENLRFYIREITRAQENERRRIAQELHDDTIQMFIAISRRLEALATLPEALPESAMRHIEQLQELTGSALRGVRYFVQDLRPPILDHLGLVAALEGLAGAMEKTGIEAELRTVGRLRRLKPEEELVLFRIAQETLNNVRKHAAASRVTIQLEFHPGKARMSLKDNGRGFDAPTRIDELFATGRLGLIGMYERAQLLGGALRIQSEPGSGTTITVEIPVRAAAQEADS